MTPAVSLVKQKHPKGCIVACIAMVVGKSYDEVAEKIGYDGSQQLYAPWEILPQFGYAATVFYRRHLLEWPPKPFFNGPHLVSVEYAEDASCWHEVVMLPDGSVLDPLHDERRTLAAYPVVNNVVIAKSDA